MAMYVGMNESADLTETLRLAETYLRNGDNVQIVIRRYGVTTTDHFELEYELFVDMEK